MASHQAPDPPPSRGGRRDSMTTSSTPVRGPDAARGPLVVATANPRYFTAGAGDTADQEAVYLTGSHIWNNLQDGMGPGPGCAETSERLDYDAYLDLLAEHGHNFIRLWRWEQVKSQAAGSDFHLCMTPQPWSRTGPRAATDGKPKFDLDRFDEAFFDRLRDRVLAAGQRGIYVAAMLFDGWALHLSPAPDHVEGHPFHAANNINRVGIGSIVDYQVLPLDPPIQALQEAYIHKVVDTLHDLPNLLWEVANESSGGGKVDPAFAETLGQAGTPEWGDSTAWQYCEGEQGRCAKRRSRPGLTLGITGVLPSDRSVDQLPRTPPGAPSADGVTSEEPGLGPRRSTVRRLAVGALPANRRAGKDDMASLPAVVRQVTVGVDSHKDVHVAAAVDQVGRVLGTTWVPTTTQGSAQLLRWATRLGQVQRFGIEGTGSFAAGLSRWLQQQGYQVVEVNRPNRQTRRRRGKSDPVDAEAAARAVLAGEATTTPKAANGTVEMLRVLRVARRSAIKARGQAANQLHSLLRHQLGGLPLARLVQVAAAVRPGPLTDPQAATKFTLRELARRYQFLTAELERLDAQLAALAPKAAPRLLARRGVGAQVAGALLVVAGDNPGRLRSEAAFSMLCGSSPLEASSGKTVRHRLNRGGDREANNALWTIAMTRLSCDERTQRYLARRTAEGKSKREIIRCLKRYIAREIYRDITAAVGS